MNLPQGWIYAKMPDVVEWSSGGTPKSDNPKYYNGTIPWLIIGDLTDNVVYSSATKITELGMIESNAKYVEKDSVLLAMYGSIGKLGIAGVRLTTNQAIAFTKALNGIDNWYLFYYLQLIKSKLFSLSKGGTQKNISLTVINSLNIPFPPLPEQHRIVSKIDSLFSELDNGVTLLKTIKAQLVVYRQAVLKWAFEGKLTNNDWKMGILEDIISEIKIGPFGTLLHKADYIENGIPIINPKHMNNQKIKYDSHTTISKQKAKDLSSYKLQENDIILARRGEMGRTVTVTEKEVGWLCGTGSMIVRLKTGNLNNLYSLFLSSERVRKYLTENCKGTTMNNLNEAIVKKIPVPICSHPEQIAIVSAIESRLYVCDKLEQTIDQTLALSALLRQSILKKAFEGRLVPQDPNDEPAEKLLERIKAEKTAVLSKQKQTRKRGGK